MKVSFEDDLAEKLSTARNALAHAAKACQRDVDLLAHSHLRLAASRELLRKPVRILIGRDFYAD